MRWSTLQTAISWAACFEWNIVHLDVVRAFLNGKLEESICVQQPDEFISPRKENLVCKLNGSIYGLKLSPRAWYAKINLYILAQNWSRSIVDYNLYYLRNRSDIVVVLLYVDDLQLTSNFDSKIVVITA